jgi:GDP-4-dehydro-6-deoxy-D-mannose reductase
VDAPSAPILITGAAGFAGSHLLDLLRAEPRPIVAWHHPTAGPTSEGAASLAGPVTWQRIDLIDVDAVRAALDACRPSAVYHLAGIAHQGKSWQQTHETLRVNALGTEHLIDGLRRLRIDARVLVIGSSTVYRPSTDAVDEDAAIGPTSPYGLSKLAQEMVGLQAFALHAQPVLVARSFNHIGPRQGPDFVASSFARQIVAIERGDAPPVMRVGNLEPQRDLMDVRDTVRAYRAIMERGQPGRAYNVCAGRARPVRELLDGLLRLSQVNVEIQVDPALLRPVDQPVLLGSHDRLTRETGWQPAIAWEQTLADLLDDWRERLRAH